jgi:hypothetical protein
VFDHRKSLAPTARLIALGEQQRNRESWRRVVSHFGQTKV